MIIPRTNINQKIYTWQLIDKSTIAKIRKNAGIGGGKSETEIAQ